MPNGAGNLPKVSIIMPTLNAAALVENCLASIARQTYPRERYEILIADGGSTDGTQTLAERFGAVVIDDRASRNMEESKRVALAQATGEFVLFVDADNEITHPDYLELAVRALAANPQALGVEAYYPPSPRMTSLCAYLTHRLHISDPLCWLMAANPRRVGLIEGKQSNTSSVKPSPHEPRPCDHSSPGLRPPSPLLPKERRGKGEEWSGSVGQSGNLDSAKTHPVLSPAGGEGGVSPGEGVPQKFGHGPEVERWALPEGCFSYPLGANGFLFRRADLEAVQADEKFQDTHVALFLMQAGKREWLRIAGRGVHHYYITTWWNFVQKRRRATVHFLRVQERMPVNWMREKPPVPLWLAGLYCVTFLGPMGHTVLGLLRDRDARWLWHVPACLGSVLGAAWGVWTYRTRRKDAKLVANLKPRQELK